MLGVAASLLAVVCIQMQQLQAMLRPAVHRGKGMTYNFGNNVQCECVASTMLEELRKRIQNCCATLRRSRNERNVKRCWLKSLTGFKLCARATTCNKVYKRMQHVSSNNVGSCWPGKLCPFAQGFTWQKRRKKWVTGLNRQEDSPETSSRLSVIPWGAKRMPAQRAGKKRKKQVKILPYGARAWQVKVVTDQFSLKPRANKRTTLFANNSQH